MTEVEFDLSEFVDLFVDEGRQHLRTLNQGMLLLEQVPGDAESLEDVFRAAHTLKGMAATMGYEAIAVTSHALEDVLHDARSRPLEVIPTALPLVFRAIDALESLVDAVAAGESPDMDVTSLLSELHAFSIDGVPGMPLGAPVEDPGFADAPALLGVVAGEEGGPSDVVVGATDVATEKVPVVEAVSATTTTAPQARFSVSPLVRIDVQRLDRLLDIVTEMMIHRSHLSRLQSRLDSTELDEAFATLARLLDQMQNAVLETRMVPISQVFNRFPRMVRDLLRDQGKRAQLVIEGDNTELDRTALAAINDSLVHLLRNAIDHGLETPDERIAAGKPAQGTLWLSARVERSAVVVEVREDGCGIDTVHVAETAVRRGILMPEEITDMTEAQILDLLCAPGFSLNTEITTVSGRGVGLDAVKAKLSALRGSLEIETQLGVGSTFRLRLPVNLAMVDALLVDVGSTVYAVPASSVESVIEIESHMLSTVGDRALLNLSDSVVPLKSVAQWLGDASVSRAPAYALLVKHQGQTYGAGVDGIVGYEQVVSKRLPPALGRIHSLSGVTIMGEGEVVFILDLTRMSERA
ncbi:MAG: chemotaxis protein CheA [Anaerolineae bacterium]|nr:chemotaxis protein CheA [Anaerolineae bacterium]